MSVTLIRKVYAFLPMKGSESNNLMTTCNQPKCQLEVQGLMGVPCPVGGRLLGPWRVQGLMGNGGIRFNGGYHI